jgi:hypothetical protein
MYLILFLLSLQPICWVFGLAVLVYQHDYFTWLSGNLNAPKVYWYDHCATSMHARNHLYSYHAN